MEPSDQDHNPATAPPLDLLNPGRRITGMSAILLPLSSGQKVDQPGFRAHVERTFAAGLVPAVNMDTGYGNLIDEPTRQWVLEETNQIADGREYVAGAFVEDREGADFDLDSYRRRIEQIQTSGGTPIIFQSFGLTAGADDSIVKRYQQIGDSCDRFLGFELGTMFAPFGKIYSTAVFRELLKIESCVGAKHSSLKRQPEWDRLRIRNQHRPDFMVLTGNDLAIDMVMYGSDYLLGLSTFCPDVFQRRDRMWLESDPVFYECNDLLQYLGFFVFRAPVPAYKHSAAMFLHLRGWIATSLTHPQSAKRPESDLEILRDIAERLGLI